jgi:hypothetical protein
MAERRTGPGARLLVDSGQPRPFAGYRADLVTSILGLWFTVGLIVDAWAHNNLTDLETFFTPWHAVFYSGFAATAGWILWIVGRQVRAGRTGLAAVPVGYGPALVGLPIFAFFGVADGVWHTVFGIEQDLDILFSPTHLIGVTAMGMILTSPLRSMLADRSVPASPTLRRLLPAVLSISFTMVLVLLFLQYGNAMGFSADTIVQAFSTEPGQTYVGRLGGRLAASIVITTLLLITPLLVLARRWALPPGTATVVHTVAALLCGAIAGLANTSTVLGLIAAGVLIDLLVVAMRPGPERPVAYRAFAGLAPLLTWAAYFGFAAVAAGRLPDVPELWTGAPIVAALLGMVLAALIGPPITPRRSTAEPVESAEPRPAPPVRT